MSKVAVPFLLCTLTCLICAAEAANVFPEPPYAGFAERSQRGADAAGMPILRPGPTRAAAEHPDDAYWNNRISSAVAGVDYRVEAIATYQGETIVGGSFTMAGGVISPGIAAWNGSAWYSLGSGVDGGVSSFAVYDGRLIAGGSFHNIGGVAANSIAAWDGASWTPLGSGISGGMIEALAVYDGKLIAGGNFTSAGGTDIKGVAAWDGSSWVSLGPMSPSNGSVAALTVYGDRLIAAGTFDAIAGVPAKKIAAWDGASWSAMGSGLTAPTQGWVSALAVHEDRLIAGGGFTAAGGTPVANLAAWDGTSWSALGAGAPWYVYCLTVFGGNLIVGGEEDTPGSRELRLVSWDGSSWAFILPASEYVNQWVNCLGVSGNTLVVGGEFQTIGGVPAASVAAWDGTSWSGFSPGNLGLSGPVRSLTVFNGRLIAGGTFLTAGPGFANSVAAWNGVTWSSLGSGVRGSPSVPLTGPFVSALSMFEGKLIAGGGFTMAGDEPANDVAAWDGASWSPMSPEFDTVNWVNCLGSYGSKLFISEGWRACPDLCIDPDEAVVAYWEGTSLVPIHDIDKPVHAFTMYGNQLVAGGEFTRAGSQPAKHVASWNGQGWAAVGGGTNGDVYALAVYQGKLIAGGFFTSAGGVPARNIAAWDGVSWSALGDGVDLRVNALAVYDGKLIVGGGATSFYFNQDFLASWDGQSWSSLGSGTNGVIYALTVYDHGLVVGGNFTTAGGKPSPYLALWTKQEIREVAVDVRPGSCPNPINVNPHAEAGQGVVPVAILGTAELDVREIEPESVMLEGVHARRWNYGDVAAPAGGQTGDCGCSTEGPDGYEDLELLFPRSELTCAMGAVSGGLGPPGRSAHETYTVQLEGFLDDGSAIEGSDCVTLVGGREALLSPQQSVSDLQVRSLSGSAGPSVRISFTLTGASHVRLGVYNVLGQEVASLIDDIRGPGPQSVIWNGDRVASGIYYYRVQADRDMETKKLLLLK